jgi:type VI secretion system secreted protein Hcp
MAVDFFLKIASIKGSALDDKHKDEIAIQSFSWGVTHTTSFGPSGGGTSGKGNVQDISLTHHIDVASPKLYDACVTGSHIEDATLVCRKSGGKESIDFLKIKFTDVVVSSVQTGGGAGDELPAETFSLAFAKYEIEYQEQDNKGAKLGGSVKTGFNVQTLKKV